MAALARFLTVPPGAGGAMIAGPNAEAVRRQLLGYSLLLNGNFVDAAKIWRERYDSTSAVASNDERVLLAWAEVETGNSEDAAKLMRYFALPPNAADPALQLLLFPRAIFLKALSEQHANNTQESKRLLKLFLDYSADRDFSYGDEKRAREVLSRP
jgi:hypothetical protein